MPMPIQTKERILKVFAGILTDNGRSFPTDAVSPAKGVLRQALYSEFKAKLMRYWSGTRVEFIASGFPKRSADGTILYLPADVRGKKDLYSKLIVATFNVETDAKHPLYGGQRERQ